MRKSQLREKDDGDHALSAKHPVTSRLWWVDRILDRSTRLSARWFEPVARIAVFIIYFWFGLLKLLNLSPATPLASALVGQTIGMPYFTLSFKALAVFECVLGLLFL